MKDHVNTCLSDDCFLCIHCVIVVNIYAHVMIVMFQAHMSSSDSGLSDAHDPMVVVLDDEPFALPDFDDDLPIADGFPVQDPFDVPAPVHDHLIIGHPDGEHIVAPILDPIHLVVITPEDWPFDDLFDDDVDLFVDGPPGDAQGDGEIDEDVVAGPPPAIPVIEISSDSSLHSVSDSFEFVTSSAIRAAGLQLYATDSDDDTAMSVAPSPARVPTPPHDPEPAPELAPIPFGQPDVAPIDPEPIHDPDHVPFGLPDITPLIPDPIPAPVDLPLAEPFIPSPAPAEDIPAPRPGEGTSGQHPSHDAFSPAAFPPISQSAPFTPFTSTPLDEPFRWFPPYSMPISDPYHL
ncbi:hypothetical protein Hanom_Chr05g00417301 [Helianthus anomalus]